MTKSNTWTPPVGVKCLFKATAKNPGVSHFTYEFTECVPEMVTPNGSVLSVGGTQCFLDAVDYDIEFKPIDSETKRKHEENVKTLTDIIIQFEHVDAEVIARRLIRQGGVVIPRTLTDEDFNKLSAKNSKDGWINIRGLADDVADFICGNEL